MSGKRTRSGSHKGRRPGAARVDLARVQAMSEREIAESSPAELANLPADFWAEAELVPPVVKQAISLRLDGDVLEWFRQNGPRYQSRMNAVLRAYMNQRKRERE